MNGKTRKQQIEKMLAEDPNDPFLRYGLAMEHVSEGEDEAAVGCFQGLLAVDPHYVAAYMQVSQALIRLGRNSDARTYLNQGIAAARQQGNAHAAEEMQGFLANLA
jgi:cytochrome c-type biogenesis protein CcmH/NrfG